MKKMLKSLLCMLLVGVLLLSVAGCSIGDDGNENALGDYEVEIKGCRLAQDDKGTDLVIVNYGFTNHSEESAAFIYTFTYEVFQNGIGLTEVWEEEIASANYSDANQMKEIKQGATLDVEVAYELNDTTTDIVVEVSRLISFSDKKVTKTLSLQ